MDEFGTDYALALLEEARSLGLIPLAVGYQTNTINEAIQNIAASKYRFIVGIFNPDTWRSVLESALQANIIGIPSYVWIFSSASTEFTDPSFSLETPELARALHGSGILSLSTPQNQPFDDVLLEFARNGNEQSRFKTMFSESKLFDGFSFQEKPGSSVYFYQLTYDAVIALGLAACATPVDNVTGPDFLETLMNLQFKGVTGEIKFDASTGSRSVDGLSYEVQNILLAPSNGTYFTFESNIVAEVRVPEVEVLSQFIYPDNSTIPPMSLPPVERNLNLIRPAMRIFGLTLGGIALLLSLMWIVWTWWYRETDVVRASQPIFLILLSVGTFIMACTVIPLSFQEPIDPKNLNFGCMAAPWLFSVGFVTAYSALISKTWRMNRLFRRGLRFRRISVRAQDVILPYVILMGLNLAILITWTLVSPLEWQRRDLPSFDQFGRTTASIGGCYHDKSNIASAWFAVPLFSVDLVAAGIASYQSLLARHVPTAYNESFYLAVSMGSILETFLIGVPILVLVKDTPGPRFLVEALLLFILCMAILYPIFWPKYQNRDMMLRARDQQQRIHDIQGGQESNRGRSSRLNLSGLSSSSSGNLMARIETEQDDPEEVVEGRMKLMRNHDYYIQSGNIEPVQSTQQRLSQALRQSHAIPKLTGSENISNSIQSRNQNPAD